MSLFITAITVIIISIIMGITFTITTVIILSIIVMIILYCYFSNKDDISLFFAII